MPSDDVHQALSALPETGYIYRTSWPLMTGDIDGDLHLRLDGAARYIQEVGAEHLVDAGEADSHPHWIVQRTVIDVIEPIEWPNQISFSRWCSGLSTRWCSMRVDLVGANGGRIETEGFWILMNIDTLTPSRAADSLIDRFSTTTTNHRLKWKPWLSNPSDVDTVTPFTLRRTDIDFFNHMTNTAYWHAIHEVMAEVPDVCTPPYRAVVEYRRPIQFGEDVTIGFRRHDDEVHIALSVGDDVRAAALLRKL